MLILPTERLIWEFGNLQHPLPEIVADLCKTYYRQRYGHTHADTDHKLRVTSIYRTKEEDVRLGGSGVHCTIPHRSIDIRMSWDWVRKCAMVINRWWVYDPQRPRIQVLVTKMHGTGAHAHLQVHRRTISREELRAGLMT